MINLEKGFGIASRNILTGFRHEHYERTLSLARQYKALITGEDLEFMLRKFDRRESEEDFKQANRIAQQITPAITSALMNPPRRLGQVKPVVDRMDYGQENDSKADKLRAEIEAFNGGIGVDQYLSDQVDPGDADPNAFVLLTFENFDERFEKPTVFPVHIPCENVYDAPRLNNEIQYLWLRFGIKYVQEPAALAPDGTVTTPAVMVDGSRYALYINNHHIVFNQVKNDAGKAPVIGRLYDDSSEVTITKDKGVAFSDAKAQSVYYFRQSKDILFEVVFYEQSSGRVPCFALGCNPDPLTGGATYVNRWHDAMPYLKKSLKQVRELDLTTAMHAIPQKLQYISKCRGKGCQGGYLHDGSDCSTCKGNGFQTISTSQDHITLPLPKDPSEAFDLTKLVHYVPLPVELIQQMRDIVKDTRSDAFRAVYGYDLFGDGKVGKTVEEVMAMNQALYTALSPFAMWRERTRVHVVTVYASYTDQAENLIVQYKYPSDFGFETSTQIVGLIKLAKEAGTSTAYRASLNAKLETTTFSDDPQMLAMIKTQSRFDPFPGKSEETVLALISGGKASERSAIRWTESAAIFDACEQANADFYELAESKQREIYNKAVDDIMAEIEAAKPEPIALPPLGDDIQDEEPADKAA